MDFTRDPIIETVITPKEGCTLVVRSSKGSGQEEYFVDAVEVVLFGNSIFFRSRERPKAFLVPASDYEILEVREARLVLKNVGLDRSIKIGGGRESSAWSAAGQAAKNERTNGASEKAAQPSPPAPAVAPAEKTDAAAADAKSQSRIEKKRERRRNYRRGRVRGEDQKGGDGEASDEEGTSNDPSVVKLPEPHASKEELENAAAIAPVAAVLSTLLPPPPTLISETIARYKDNALFKGAFFNKDEEEEQSESVDLDLDEERVLELSSDDPGFFSSIEPEAGEIQLPNISLEFPIYKGEESSPFETEPVPEEEISVIEEDVGSIIAEVTAPIPEKTGKVRKERLKNIPVPEKLEETE